MRKLDRSTLLEFLSKPHHPHEVAEHFQISSSYANYHLKEAVKAGQVLVSEKPVFKSHPNFRAGLKQLNGFLYVSRSSPLLFKDSSQLVRDASRESAPVLVTEATQVKFTSEAQGQKSKAVDEQNISAFTDRKTNTISAVAGRLKSKVLFSPFLNVLAAKGKSSGGGPRARLLRHERSLSQSSYEPLSHVERMRLFESMLNHPLTFLEVHGRFRVSRQVIEGFVQRGLLKEVWGPRDIGVRFMLSKKGEKHLEELREAASFEPPKHKKFLGLKRETFS
jgi:hypothetical protein